MEHEPLTTRRMTFTGDPIVGSHEVADVVRVALAECEGLLRLMPNWVPRSFLQPGGRLKLDAKDWYAYGLHRGGIDERWLASTTDADNEGRVWHEGQSVCEFDGRFFLFKEAVDSLSDRILGERLSREYGRWPVLGKFFDNVGQIPLHMHQSDADAALVGQEGKPESYYFPPQLNSIGNAFPYTFFGLDPGTTKEQLRDCLRAWNRGDNGILDLSRAYRLETGTGWLVPPGLLHAPGSLCTYEPQWGSDVFSMFQSLVDGREIPRELLVKSMPPEKHLDIDFIIGQLDWEQNVDPYFKQHHYLEPVIDKLRTGAGYTDRWIVYGEINGRQLFSAKELAIEPGAHMLLQDPGASGWITVQGHGRLGRLAIESPTLIRFGKPTLDEVFITHEAANRGIEVENTGSEPLVSLRHFGPNAHADMPALAPS